MRTIVTGAAGFIGSHVVDRLLAQGHEVVGIDNFDPYYDPQQKRRNVAAASKSSAYRLVDGDICDRDLVEQAFDDLKPTGVVHLAARAGVRASVEQPAAYLQVNEVGGLNVLDACRRRDGIPICFASTSSVYGASSQIPFRETQACTEPLSPYAATKRSAELMVYTYNHLFQQPAAVLRFFTVYGPRGRPDMAVYKFTQRILAGEPISLHGEDTKRDFTFVDDIVGGVLGSLEWVTRTRGYDTFNLGRSEPVRVRPLIELLSAQLGKPAKVVLGELQPGESPVTYASTERARSAFGYDPTVSLAQGVDRWMKWLEASPEAPPLLRQG